MLKKILIIRINCDEYGGIEHQIINIVSNFNLEEYQFILCTKSKTSRLAKDFEKYGKVFEIKGDNIFRNAIELNRICKKENITIVQTHMFRESYIAKIVKLINRNLVHIYRVHTYIDCSFIPRWKKNIYHFISKLTDFLVDKYLPINNANRIELLTRTRVKKSKILLLHNGVRKLNDYSLNKNFNCYDIVMIANFVYGKGHDIAIKALEILCDKCDDYHLYFIGGENTSSNVNQESEYTQTIKTLISQKKLTKNVSFLGFKDDIGKEIENKDIVILPSYSEGTPNCLLEVMSINKLVIASEVGGIPEFIFNNQTGFLHKNKDYKKLAEIIMKIKSMDVREINLIKKQGYDMWKREFSIEQLVNNLSKIYNYYIEEKS